MTTPVQPEAILIFKSAEAWWSLVLYFDFFFHGFYWEKSDSDKVE